MKQTKLVEITDIEKQKAILEEAGQIIRDGGLRVGDEVVMPKVVLTGRSEEKLRACAEKAGVPVETTTRRPSSAAGSSIAKPGISVAISNRTWPGSRK